MTRTRLIPAVLLFAGALMIAGCGRKASTDTTILLPVREDPTISFNIWFAVGSQNDPAGKEGLANLTAMLISEGGTSKDSYEQILEKLYPLASGYGVNVDKEMTTITGRIHKDNLEAYYPLFTNAILHPGFKDEDFTRVKSDLLNQIEKTLRYSSDEELGKATLYDFIYDGTPYGHLDIGTVESLNRITLDDVKEFYKKYFTRDNVKIALGGGYEDNLIDRLEKDLATLPAGKVAPVEKSVPKPVDGVEIRMVEKECDATAISFGFPIDVVRGDDDFFALAVFNSWFGEHRNSSSHLYQVIREKRGMNYGDYSYIEIFPNGGRRQMPAPNNARRQQLFEVWIRPVQHMHRHFALRAAMRELQNAVQFGMTQEAFETTKKFLQKYALHFAPTVEDQLGYAVDSRFYGIKGDYIDLYRQKIAALTLDQVNAAIRKHLQVKNLKIAIVTKDAAKFRDAIVNNTPSPVTYEMKKPMEMLSEDKVIESWLIPVKPEKVQIIPVEEMFQK